MIKREMPSIKSLLSESWTTFKSSFGSVFVLSLLGSIIGFTVTIFCLIAVVGVGFLTTFGKGLGDKAETIKQIQNFLTPQILAQIGFGFLIIFLLGWIISTIVRIAIIHTIGNSSQKPRLTESLGVGFALLIPTMIISIVTSFITFGSSFLLIIPSIIISFLFYFVSYEMILGNKKWFSAITGSVQIMSQYFGEVLLRVFVFAVGIYLVFNLPIDLIQMIVKGFSEKSPVEAASILGVLGIIRFVVGIFTAFYSLVYGVTNYQHAKKVTDESIKPSLVWIWVVTVIGWLIAILIGIQLVKVYQSPLIQDKVKMMMDKVKTSSAPQLSEQDKIKSIQEAIKPDAKPYWDKSNELFKEMHDAKDVKIIKSLNDQNITSLRKAIEIDQENAELWSSLGDAYTWVSTSGKPADVLSSYKKAEELSPDLFKYQYSVGNTLLGMEKYDEAILQLQKANRTNDGIGRGHISLGIAYKRTGLKDTAKDELQKGIDILTKYNDKGDYDSEILSAKKELETVDQAAVVKNTTSAAVKPVASCTTYPIREGEFASNKCYVKKDYDDLLYYLGRYNSAASAYNGAASSSSITCNGSDFFKAQCEEDKKTMTNAQSQIDGYKATIRTLISRGK